MFELLNLLSENLENCSYYVSKNLTEELGYEISQERAALLIARSLIRQYCVDKLTIICKTIELKDCEEFGNELHKVLND